MCAKVAILPMGFCYLDIDKSGELPPRRECAATWRAKVVASMPDIELTLVFGQYALAWHLKDGTQGNLTNTVLT